MFHHISRFKPLSQHWHYTTMTVSYEPIEINPFLTPCQPLYLLCTPFIINILQLMRAFPRPHHSTFTISLMYVKNTLHHFCLLHLLSGTLERRKWKKDEQHQIKWLYYNQFSMYQRFLYIPFRTTAKQLQ